VDLHFTAIFVLAKYIPPMRKSIAYISTLFATLIFLSGCNPGPKTVAQHFMNAVVKTNFEEAKKYATKDSQDMINLLANISNTVPQAKEKIRSAKVSVKDVQINGDKATVTFYNKEENKEQTLNLVKEDGQWKVSLNIENYLPGFGDPHVMDSTGSSGSGINQ
jgi:Domain of unknown function (DUF4878)